MRQAYGLSKGMPLGLVPKADGLRSHERSVTVAMTDYQEGEMSSVQQASSSRPVTIHSFVWMRAFGAVAIVILHAFITVQKASDPASITFLRDTAEAWVSIVLTRWAVPAFFMMSGALMLDPARDVSWNKIGRHVWRLVFVLLTIGFAFCIVEEALEVGSLGPAVVLEAFLNLLRGKSWDHLWFVYRLIGFYLITPVIRPYVAQASRRELLAVVAGMFLLMQGVNTLGTLVGVLLWSPLDLAADLAWYVAGYAVHRYVRLNRQVALAGAGSLLLMLILRVVYHDSWMSLPEHAVVVPYAIAVFAAFEHYCEKPVRDGGAVKLLADYSFGIYLLHPAAQHALVRVIDMGRLPVVAADLVAIVVPLVASVATVWALRLLPPFRDKL